MGVNSSFFDRNGDLLESALAVLLATINILVSCTLIWYSGLKENPELSRVTARYAVGSETGWLRKSRSLRMFQPPPLWYQVSPFDAKVPTFTVDDTDRRARSSRWVGLIF